MVKSAFYLLPKGIWLDGKETKEKDEHKPKIVSRKPSQIKSYRGMIIKEEEEVVDS